MRWGEELSEVGPLLYLSSGAADCSAQRSPKPGRPSASRAQDRAPTAPAMDSTCPSLLHVNWLSMLKEQVSPSTRRATTPQCPSAARRQGASVCASSSLRLHFLSPPTAPHAAPPCQGKPQHPPSALALSCRAPRSRVDAGRAHAVQETEREGKKGTRSLCVP